MYNDEERKIGRAIEVKYSGIVIGISALLAFVGTMTELYIIVCVVGGVLFVVGSNMVDEERQIARGTFEEADLVRGRR